MTRAVEKHLRDALAILFLAITAAGVAGYILSNQRFDLPGWIPVVGSDFYELEAEFASAQAVVPGQGQTVAIAGVKVGDIKEVRLEDGVAVVGMELDERFRGRVFRDASILLRPKTGLKDMYLQLDPGTRRAGALPDHERVPARNTLPDVNPDEVLAGLDADTRAYLQVLLGSGGEAFPGEPGGGNGAVDGRRSAQADLRGALRRFEPTGRDVRRITGLLAERRRNVRRVVRSFRLLSGELANHDDELARLVEGSAASFEALASEGGAIRTALRELPPTLATARGTLTSLDALAREAGPALEALRPAARNLGPALRDVRPFLAGTTPVIRERLRPFARESRDEVRVIRQAAEDLAPTTERLVGITTFANSLLNTLAYNPPGKAEEGFLFWASWANHAGASVFGTQDAHGPIRRGIVLASCSSLGVLEEVGKTNPNLQVLIDLLNAPRTSAACPSPTPGSPSARSGEEAR